MNRRYKPQVCREGTGRVPSDALLHQTEPGYMSAAPGRRPVGPVQLVKGRLVNSIFTYLLGNRSCFVGYMTINAAEMKFGRVLYGLENPRQAACLENRMGPGGFMKAPLVGRIFPRS